jgi:formyl-CoA transferase
MALSIGDSVAGLFAVQGILAALHSRNSTGIGQVVDVSLADSCLALTESMIPDYDRAGLVREPSGTRLDGIAPSNIYRSADGLWLIVAANQDSLFRRLCDAMEQPALAEDPRFQTHIARSQHQDALDELVGAWVGQRPASEVTYILERAGVVCGPIQTVAEVVRDPHFLARQMIVRHRDEHGLREPVLGPGLVPHFSRTSGEIRWAGPERGQHNDLIFEGLLGLDRTKIQRLQERKVV